MCLSSNGVYICTLTIIVVDVTCTSKQFEILTPNFFHITSIAPKFFTSSSELVEKLRMSINIIVYLSQDC